MRVAIDYTPAIQQGAGIGRYTRSLVAALAQLESQHRYILFCAGQAPDRNMWPDNFDVRRTIIPSRWLTLAWHKLRLPLAAEQLAGDCDIFHSPDFTLPPLKRARGIVTVHDLSFLRLPHCADPGLRAYLERSVPQAVKRAHHILADSANTRKDLVELLQVPPDQVSVVPAGVDSKFSRIQDSAKLAEIRKRYKLPSQFVLSVGTLEPRKNFARLVSAFALLRRRTGLPHGLVIAGRPGWLYDEVFKRVTAEGLEQLVHFPGYVADGDLPGLYSLAELMVFPSLYEGFGIPPLEAMACETPVVCSDNSSLPETVGGAAVLVNAEDTEAIANAMAQVVTDVDLRARLVGLGQAQAARFSWHVAAQELLSAYESLLA